MLRSLANPLRILNRDVGAVVACRSRIKQDHRVFRRVISASSATSVSDVMMATPSTLRSSIRPNARHHPLRLVIGISNNDFEAALDRLVLKIFHQPPERKDS